MRILVDSVEYLGDGLAMMILFTPATEQPPGWVDRLYFKRRVVPWSQITAIDEQDENTIEFHTHHTTYVYRGSFQEMILDT